MSALTAERARELLTYDPDTGVLTWKPRSGQGARNDTAGKPAGSAHKDGYLAVEIGGQKYLAHRVIWLLVTGQWPAGEIDHRDRNRRNNVWSNLRDVTKTVNQQNRSDVTGVDLVKRTGKWRARITVNKRQIALGNFADKEMAVAAYKKAKEVFHA